MEEKEGSRNPPLSPGRTSEINFSKECCDEEICDHPFGYDVCGRCHASIKREAPLALRCPKCGAVLRNPSSCTRRDSGVFNDLQPQSEVDARREK